MPVQRQLLNIIINEAIHWCETVYDCLGFLPIIISSDMFFMNLLCPMKWRPIVLVFLLLSFSSSSFLLQTRLSVFFSTHLCSRHFPHLKKKIKFFNLSACITFETFRKSSKKQFCFSTYGFVVIRHKIGFIYYFNCIQIEKKK